MGPVRHDIDDGAADDGHGAVDGSWEDVQWRPLLNVLFWNLNYYDSASAFAGNIHTSNTVQFLLGRIMPVGHLTL